MEKIYRATDECMTQTPEELTEQLRLTNMAVKALAHAVESGEWQGLEGKVVSIMLGEVCTSEI